MKVFNTVEFPYLYYATTKREGYRISEKGFNQFLDYKEYLAVNWL